MASLGKSWVSFGSRERQAITIGNRRLGGKELDDQFAAASGDSDAEQGRWAEAPQRPRSCRRFSSVAPAAERLFLG